MDPAVVVFLAAVTILVVALAVSLVLVALVLRRVLATLEEVEAVVADIARGTEPLGEVVGRVRGDLQAIAETLARLPVLRRGA